MSDNKPYSPSNAHGAKVIKEGQNWTLALVRDLRHSPEVVWQAITDPEHLRKWAPFDADGNLGVQGATVNLSTVCTPNPQVSETIVTRAEEPKLLEYKWGEYETRWELESIECGTRLTLWTKIDNRYIAMGAAGWHICLDVLDHLLSGCPIDRIAGMDALKFEGWQRLHKEYASQFDIELLRGQ